ncbi:hypothetical protein DFH09DRAFT_1284295 [Mycena vulgaris]|nr:hypothetical protein DFH09DRAFT_1284295 [Mycena vulgaris]
MPGSQELFVECIGKDSYGHRAYSPLAPSKHRYNWKSAPPKVDDHVVNDYDARQLTSDRSRLAIAELLDTTASVHNCEAARIGLYEVIVSEMMTSSRIGHDIRHLEAVADRAEISSELASVGVSMIDLAIGRMAFSKAIESAPTGLAGRMAFINALRKRPKAFSATQLEFSWLAPDICLRITTHLDDERNMKKALLDLVDEVILRRKLGRFTYGIVFSFFHCIIVRVDAKNSFTSTALLQFLPDFYATSPSTDGIIAIARLGYYCYTAAMTSRVVNNTLPPNHFLNKVPLDVLEHIAANLDPADLQSFRSVTPLFEPATDTLLRYPSFGYYRLLHVAEASANQARRKPDVLTTKAFSAVIPSSRTFVPELLVRPCHSGSSYFSVPFGEKTRRVEYDVKTKAA